MNEKLPTTEEQIIEIIKIDRKDKVYQIRQKKKKIEKEKEINNHEL